MRKILHSLWSLKKGALSFFLRTELRPFRWWKYDGRNVQINQGAYLSYSFQIRLPPSSHFFSLGFDNLIWVIVLNPSPTRGGRFALPATCRDSCHFKNACKPSNETTVTIKSKKAGLPTWACMGRGATCANFKIKFNGKQRRHFFCCLVLCAAAIIADADDDDLCS